MLRSMTPRTFSASLLLALSLAACGGSVALPEGSQDTTAACTALYASYAMWAKGCSGVELPDDDVDHLVASCTARAALPGVDAPAAAIAACGARIAASSCAALPVDCIMSDYQGDRRPYTSSFLINDDEVGYQLFPRTKGQLAAGQACDLAAQCQSGACTTTYSYVHDQGCGICVDVKKAGEACSATTMCDYGSTCTDGVCVGWGNAVGEACEAPKGESNCQRHLHCPNGTCVPRLHVGDSCGDTFDQWEACPRGSVCHASTCQLVVEGHAGDACDDIVVGCGMEMFCAEGHCRKPVANVGPGGACTGDICAPGLRCRDSVCAAPPQAGDSCYDDIQCAPGLICPTILVQAPRCSAPRQEDEACESTDACDNGLFCDGAIPKTPLCHRKGASGEACSEGIPCWAPLTCREGVCSDLGVCSTL